MAIKRISANLLGGNAVTAAKIAGGAISAADIADNSITAAKISASTSPTFGGVTINGTSSLGGLVTITGTAPRIEIYETDTTNVNGRIDSSGGDLNIKTIADDGGTQQTRIKVDHSTGDVSFYEDTGTTQKLLWDASQEYLGVGMNNPSYVIDATDTTGNAYISVNRGTQSQGEVGYKLGGGTGGGQWFIYQPTSSNDIRFYQGSDKVIFASDGKVDMYPSGAETTGGLRVIYDGDNNYEVARFQSNGDYDAHISFVSNGTTGYYWSAGIDYSDSGKFKIARDNLLTVNTALTIDSSGNVGIGTTSPDGGTKLDVRGNVRIGDGSTVEQDINFQSANGSWQVGSNDSGGGTSGNQFYIYDTSTGAYGLTVQRGGGVGIGYNVTSPATTLEVSNTTNSQKLLGLFESQTAGRAVALGVTETGVSGQAAIYGTDTNGSSTTQSLYINPDGGYIILGKKPVAGLGATVTADGNANATTFRMSYDYGNATVGNRGANLDFQIGNAAGSDTKITTNYWSGGSGKIDISAYGQDNQILLYEDGMVEFSDGFVKLGGYSYVGEDLADTDSLCLMSDYTENIIFGQRDRANNVWTESFRIDRYGNMNAPGTIIQTQVARADNVVGTGNFDVISLTITPKFTDTDMIIHFYTQWSVITNDGEDWGLQLQRDGTAINGDTQSNYFISGGGVDAYDFIGQGSNAYGVNFASKTDIDTGRSSSTSTITYKIRKVVPGNTSTKTVRFGVDGWTGGGSESQRSKIVLMVQEVVPN